MAKKKSHLMLLVGGGVLLVILFFVMVNGKKEGFRPPGEPCGSFNTESESDCDTKCSSYGGKKCVGYYSDGKTGYNANSVGKATSAGTKTQGVTVNCECYVPKPDAAE